jgi:thermitase
MPHKSFPKTASQARRPRSSRHAAALLLALAAACVFVFLGARGASGQSEGVEIDADPDGAPYVAGELIVTYEKSIPESPVARVTEEVESAVEADLELVDAQLLGFPEVKEEGSREEREEILEEKKEELESDPAVASVDYNYLKELEAVPNDPLFGRQWHLDKISASAAWDATQGDSNTKIAVIDSGVDLDHPDFAGEKIANKTECTVPDKSDTSKPPANICVDGDGANDTNGHGTHVAGIASAATGNGEGVAGTCPDCSLLIARAEDRSGMLTDASIIAAIEWSIANDADVINMSYSCSCSSEAEESALNAASAAGITLVAAAGNQENRRPRYPAAYESVMSVAATTRQDTRDYTNFGPTIDVSAPGGSSGQNNAVFSTLLNGRYGNKTGTSMASPVVAGIAGLLSSRGLSNTEIRERIESTATDLGPRGRDDSFGHGRVNANAAVNDLARNTQPIVSNLKPGQGATSRKKRVRIGAVVRDAETDLTKQNVTLFVDGKRVNFAYDTDDGRLTRTMKLPPRKHNVRVVVRDGETSREVRWGFRTVERRSGRSPGRGSAGGGGNNNSGSSVQSVSQKKDVSVETGRSR